MYFLRLQRPKNCSLFKSFMPWLLRRCPSCCPLSQSCVCELSLCTGLIRCQVNCSLEFYFFILFVYLSLYYVGQNHLAK